MSCCQGRQQFDNSLDAGSHCRCAICTLALNVAIRGVDVCFKDGMG